eukprot:scaffold114268_cov37-Cyclotella_meneghiniana.AAC.4
MSDDNPQSQGNNDIIPMEILTAMFAEWNYGHGRSIIIIRSTSATISMISSCCIIRMIMKSQDRLSTTYHRLLLGMSVGDILFSLPLITFAAMAPTDLSYMVWNARGNQATCTTAGFFVTIGVYLTLFYSCSLNIYYLILIKYNKSESYIRKKVEPFLHGIPISLALIWSIIGIVNKIYNDGGTGSCLTATYNPPHCDGYEDGEVREGFTIPCGRGQGEVFYTISGIVVLLIPPVVIGVSLAMLYRHVSKQEKIMSRYGAGALNTTSDQSASDQNRDRAFSRAVLNKAIAYSSSYFLTWLWHIGGAIMGLQGAEKIPLAYKYLWNIFGPLQGFFNLLIFMHPKVQAVKKSNGTDNISWPRAFVRAFWSGLVGRASNNTKNKNAHPALAGSVGQNNKTYATALSSNSVFNTGSTPHDIPPVTEASQAPLGSDDFHKNGNTSNADES